MSYTYAVGDIHGRLDLLEKALNEIEQHRTDEPITIVFCGDYVDRGFQSAQVVDLLMAGPTDPDDKWICLMGNHEDMMLQCIESQSMGWWVDNGGGATLLSYNADFKKSSDVYPLSDHMLSHLRWMEALPFHYLDEHRAFVHAGFNPNHPLIAQIPQHMMWDRNLADTDYSFEGRFVVHGHTVVQGGPVVFANKVNLDAGAVFYGSMPIAVFDDNIPGAPVDFLEATGPTIQELHAERMQERERFKQ